MPAEHPQGWTVDTLHELMLRLFDEHDKRYEQRFQAQESAITQASLASEKRFDNTNEWRRTVSDMIAAMAGNRTGQRDIWGYLVGAAGIILAAIALWKRGS